MIIKRARKPLKIYLILIDFHYKKIRFREKNIFAQKEIM